MPSLLAKILNQPERVVNRAIDRLESANGYNSEDVRLLAENSQAVRQKIADLSLDPADTTGQELYQALQVKFAKDNSLIDRAVGVGPQTSPGKRVNRSVALAKIAAEDEEIWSMKYPAAKRLLRAQSPKKLMKALNYRSVDSLLKRESIARIYLALPYAESPTWQKTFTKSSAKLTASDYELRRPEFKQMTAKYKSLIKDETLSVSSNSMIGAVGLWPTTNIQNISVMSLALILLGGLENLTHTENYLSIAKLNPALLWWEQSKDLLAVCGEDLVSFNFKDVAMNHLHGADLQNSALQYGRQSLWSELTSRYHNKVAELGQALSDTDSKAGTELSKLSTASLPPRYAYEYEEAIANEF